MTFFKTATTAFSSKGSLGTRAASSSVWTIFELSFNQSLRLLSNLIMTRILLPEAFGLMAMVTTLIVSLNLFTDIGLRQSVIRSAQGDDPHYLRAAWTVQVVRYGILAGVVLIAGVLLWILAPHFAPKGTVYEDERLPFLIMVSSPAVVFQGLQSINLWLADRHLAYSRPALISVSGQVVSLLAMLVLVWIHPSVWALLGGTLVGTAYKTVMSHLVLSGPTMGLVWDETISKELWTFGKWLILSSAFTFVINNIDRLILGALLDKEMFGFYAIASIWVRAGYQVLSQLSSRVGLSTIGRVHHSSPEKLASVHKKFDRIFAVVTVLSFFAAIIGGKILFDLLYLKSYSQAAAFVPLLSLMLLPIIFQPLSNVLLINGDSKGVMLNRAVAAIALVVALPLAHTYFGTSGFLLALGMAPLVAAPVLISRGGRLLNQSMLESWAWIGVIMALGAATYVWFPV